MSDFNPFDQPPTGAPAPDPVSPVTPVNPIVSPKGSPWKPAVAGFGAAVVLGAGVFGLTRLGGDDDAVSTQDSIAAAQQEAIAEAQEQVQEQVGEVQQQAQEAVDEAVSQIPSRPPVSVPDVVVPPVTPDVTTPGITLPEITIPDLGDLTIPEFAYDDESLTAISECLGFDLSQIPLDDLGDVPELGELPSISIPGVDLSELEDTLGELENMSPDELENLDLGQLVEDLLGDMGLDEILTGSIPELGDLDLGDLAAGSIPDLSDLGIPPFSVPFDLGELEACFAEVEPTN